MHRPEPNFNVAAQVIKQAELNPSDTAIIFEGAKRTYGEFAQRVRSLAGLLRGAGVCVGDRVGFLGFNQPSFIETMFATVSLGAIFVPLNFRLTGEELAFIIDDAGVHSLIVDPDLIPVVESVRERLPCRRFYSVHGALDGFACLEQGLSVAAPVSEIATSSPHDMLLIMYTSGTTGLPKGAMLTHGNIVWNNVNASLAFGANKSDVLLTAAPLFHIGGLNVMTISAFQMGSPLVLLRHFDPEAVLDAIEEHSVTHMFGAPAMFLFMAQHPTFAARDLSSIEILIVGAAPCPESLISLYGQRGISFCQGYGLTETSPFASFLGPQKCLEKLGSAGLPPVHTELRIVDNDNVAVGPDERGEICIKGPNIMKGYWNRPEATANAIDEMGWFHSGDVGYIDEEGYLYICDRLKDMVITGGENVYPAEVESVLFEHPAITEVAVIGLPDEKWGEAVTAVAAVTGGSDLTLEGLRDFAVAKLARYKLPSRLHIVEALPRNPAGKVLKFELRETLA